MKFYILIEINFSKNWIFFSHTIFILQTHNPILWRKKLSRWKKNQNTLAVYLNHFVYKYKMLPTQAESQNVEPVDQCVADSSVSQTESTVVVINDAESNVNSDDYRVGQVRKLSNNINSVAKRARLQDKETNTWVCFLNLLKRNEPNQIKSSFPTRNDESFTNIIILYIFLIQSYYWWRR